MLEFLKNLIDLLLKKPKNNAVHHPQQIIGMSENGLTVLKYFESCKLEAYWDKHGKVWTIGWGETGPDVVPGLVITQAYADLRLKKRLETEFVPGVKRLLKIEPTQGQLDAMVDLAYNIGLGNFASSTLLKLYNQGDMKGAAAQFKRWRFAGGQPLLGLYRRRVADEALFNGATGDEAIKKGAAVDRIDI